MVLDEILERKRKEVNELKEKTPLTALIKQAKSFKIKRRSFKQALTQDRRPHLICELKKASPSEGLLRQSFNVGQLAKEFEEAGASAISVLTERHYFLGEPDYLNQARLATQIPILRKDFIFDAYQVYETQLLGADAFLLIVGLLSNAQLKELMGIAKEFNLDVLVEVHTEEELNRAVEAGSEIIGINNRNLETLKTDLSVSERLIAHVPKNAVTVAESGIETPEEIERYERLGIHAFLVGTSLMKSKNIKEKISELINGARDGKS